MKMNTNFYKWIMSMLVLALCFAPFDLSAQSTTTGKISGRIVDSQTGEPLPGANIFIPGTSLGTASDLEGRYLILNVPAGTYTVKCQFIGYKDVTVSNVKILVATSVNLDFAMEATLISGEEVVISAERPIIAKDQTGSLRVLTSEVAQNMPIRGVTNMLATSAGVVQGERGGELNIRGGRGNETSYVIDGVISNDPLTGRRAGSVPHRAVEEMTLMTGGYNAEHGNAMSGVVNIITKSGGEKYSGNLEILTEEFLGEGTKGLRNYGQSVYGLSLGGPIFPNRRNLMRWYGSVEYGFQRDQNPGWANEDFYDLAIQSFPSLRQAVIETWQPLHNSRNTGIDLDALMHTQSSVQDMRPGVLPNNARKDWTWTQKMTFELQPFRLIVGANGRITDSQFAVLSYLLFNAHRQPLTFARDNQVYARLTHTLGTRTFYEAQLSWLRTNSQQKDPFLKDNYWLYGDSASVRLYGNPNLPSAHKAFFTSQGGQVRAEDFGNHNLTDRINNFYGEDDTRFWQFNLNFTHQMGQHHEFKFGGEYRYHTLRKYSVGPVILSNSLITIGDERYFLANQKWIQDKNYGQLSDAEKAIYEEFIRQFEIDEGSAEQNFAELRNRQGANYRRSYLERYGYDYFNRKLDDGPNGPKHPKIGALYIQDKIEYADFILNMGLRYDYWNSNDRVIKDLNDITNSKEVWEYDASGKPVRLLATHAPQPVGDGDIAEDSYTNSEVYHMFSPRLGFSFPVTDRTVFYAQWGKFSQMPRLQDLYVGREYFQFVTMEAATFQNFSNPNLKPERTTSYEMGIRNQIGMVASIQVTAFYKEIKDLIQTGQILSQFNPGGFSVYTNMDYATVRGVELTLDFRRWHNLAGAINYTLSFAKGTGSDPDTQFNIAWQSGRQPKYEIPLDFDQRHTATINLDYRLGKNQGWMSDLGLNLLFRYNSGRPYTKKDANVAPPGRLARPLSGINAVTGPANSRVDLKIDKTVWIGTLGINLYLQAVNLFNQKLVSSVYVGSGQPDASGYLTSDNGRALLNAYDEAERELYLSSFLLRERTPFNYGTPRRLQLGLQIFF